MKQVIAFIVYILCVLCISFLMINTKCFARFAQTKTIKFAQTKTIKFATEATFPPFVYVNPKGKIQGFDVDVMNALCKKIGATCTLINQPFDSLVPSLKLGKFDAILEFNITAERAKQVDFTKPFYVNTFSFVAAKTSKLTISSSDLKGKIIGVQNGSTSEHYVETMYGNLVKIKHYPSNEQALLDLKNGRLDAVLTFTDFIGQWLKKGNSKDFAIIGKPIKNQKLLGGGAAIAVKKGNTELLQSLNKALAKIKADGTLKKLEQKYFGTTK